MNPRPPYGSFGFQDRCIQPLCHFSMYKVRDLNPQPSACKADALPLRQPCMGNRRDLNPQQSEPQSDVLPIKLRLPLFIIGQEGTRTPVAVRREIYSLLVLPLTDLPFHNQPCGATNRTVFSPYFFRYSIKSKKKALYLSTKCLIHKSIKH